MQGYSGGVFGAIPVSNAESKVEDSIKQGTSDAKATTSLSEDEGQAIVNAIDNLIPDIKSSLIALGDKKSQFASAGLTSTVQTDLANLKQESDDFADALIAIAPADLQAKGSSQKAEIDDAFSRAIAYFAN